jgi:hypothetical protein
MRDLVTQATGRGSAVKRFGFIAMHAAVAAAFMFLLQRFALSASLESSLLWTLTFAVCAAGLAYKQANR